LLQAGELSWGLFYAVMSGVVWAGGSTFLKRYPVDASPLVIAAWQLALGAVTTFPMMLATEALPDPRTFLATTWIAFGLHVVLAQAVATTIWFTMLSGLPSGIAAIGSLLVPGIGVIGAAIIIGEHPTPADWIGLVLIVTASACVLLRAGPRPAAASV
jgi:drug/metabolite transporter (DMT)-like permease